MLGSDVCIPENGPRTERILLMYTLALKGLKSHSANYVANGSSRGY